MHMSVQKSSKPQGRFWPLDSRSFPPEPQHASGYSPSLKYAQRKQSFKRCIGDFYRPPSLKRKAGSPNLVADQFQKPYLFDSNQTTSVFDKDRYPLERQKQSLDLHREPDVTHGPCSFTESTDRHQGVCSKNAVGIPSFNEKHAWENLVDGTSQVEQIASERDHRAPKREPAATFASENFRSDASTLFVPNSPLPPPRSQHTPPTSSEEKDEPNTPTVYHFRGASFEFVNPRHSLQLQDIETPAERDTDKAEYFPVDHRHWPISDLHSRARMPSSVDDDNKRDLDRRTPPRSLFDDLQSAYQSITSRPLPATNGIKSSQQLSLDCPTPTSVPQGLIPKGKLTSSDDFFGQNEARVPRHPSSTPSFRQRCRPSPNASKAPEVKLSMDRTNPHHIGQAIFPKRLNNLAEAQPKLQEDTVNDSILKLNFPDPYSPPKSGIKSDDAQSWEGKIQSINQVDCRVSHSRSIEREHDSTDDLIASYCYDTSPTIYRVRPSKLSRHQSLPMLDDRASTLTVNKRTDSTIGEILDQYNRQDTYTSVATDSATRERGRCASTPSNLFSESVQDRDLMEYRQHRQDVEPQQEVKTTDKVRAATARALATTAGPAPQIALPTSPLGHEQRCNSMSRNMISDSCSPTSNISYGDTNHLLLSSPASFQDTAKVKYHHYGRRHTESETLNGDSGRLSHRSQSSTQALDVDYSCKVKRTSQRSLDDMVKQDIKYLRQLSGLSDFHGSVYVVGGNGSSFGASDEEGISTGNIEPENSLEYATRLRRVSQSPGDAVCVPVAAFKQSSVVPGIFRLDTSERDAFGNQGDQQIISADATNKSDTVQRNERRNEKAEYGSEESEDEGFDWETLPESIATLHNQNLRSQEFDDWSSCESGPSSNRTALLSNGPDTPLPSKSRTPHFSKPLLQKATFQFGDRLRALNQTAVLPTSSNIYNTYTHPVPLSKTVENPFTSSPPQITGPRSSPTAFDITSQPSRNTTKKESKDLPLIRLGDHHVLIGEEWERSLRSSLSSRDFGDAVDSVEDNESDLSLPSHDSSTRLNKDAGHEFSLEAEKGSPAGSRSGAFKSRFAKLSSGIDPSLIHALRQGEHRMGSSPLSRSNSFARLTHLGPKSNLTGTPNGTGMREVGSSLVGSSPLEIPISGSPRTPCMNPLSDSQGQLCGSPVPPFAVYEQHTKRSGDNFPPGLSVVADNIRGETNFRDAMMAQSRADTISFPQFAFRKNASTGKVSMPRRSMGNLSTKEKTRTEWTRDAIQSMHIPSAPIIAPNIYFPKLLRRYRSPSSRLSTTRGRKQKLSWVFFGFCSIFPYLLILYGHGLFDLVMAYWTDGEIEHCGRRQKLVAKILGWGSAAATILVVVILFIVVKTVPNDYPR